MPVFLMLVIGLFFIQPTFANEAVPKISPCGEKVKMQKLLNEKFGEEPLLWGTIRGGAIITIYAGPKANWTMTKTVNDVLCIMAIGKDLKVVDHVGKHKTI
mgnify:FL=1|tara:strand:- start:1098 stop:1400 length:303 start_codon:yes stop_codon:yes gene_type:complete